MLIWSQLVALRYISESPVGIYDLGVNKIARFMLFHLSKEGVRKMSIIIKYSSLVVLGDTYRVALCL